MIRQRHHQVGGDLAQNFGDPPFVRGIGVAVDQADGDRGQPRRLDAPCDVAHRILVQRRLHRAVPKHPLGHLEYVLARHQRHRPVGIVVIEVPALLAPDQQHVAKAARGDQAGGQALALDDGVGGDGRRMRDVADLGQVHAAAAEHLRDSVDHGDGWVIGAGQHLADLQPAAAGVVDREVGECPADIHAYAQIQHVVTCVPLMCCRPAGAEPKTATRARHPQAPFLGNAPTVWRKLPDS
jgi:hypothetical protein